MAKKKTIEIHEQELVAFGSCLKLLSKEYVNSSTTLQYKCGKCNELVKEFASKAIKRINGCGRCEITMPTTKEETDTLLAELNWEVVGQFTYPTHKTVVRCLKCGEEGTRTPSGIIRARSKCKRCYGKKKRATDQYNELLASTDKNVILIEPYRNARESHKHLCLTCNYEWSLIPKNIISGDCECPSCNNLIPTKTYNLAVVNPHLLLEWDYEKNISISPYDLMPRSGTKVWWKCAKKGHSSFKSVDQKFDHGCFDCSFGQQKSKKEEEVFDFVKSIYAEAESGTHALPNTRFSFDVWLPSLRKAVEFDGVYWHSIEKKKDRDDRKNKRVS